MDDSQKPITTSSPTPDSTPIVVDAEKLFQGQREIVIEFGGAHYRLRITRRNKLILQK
jgi:hemin uptake protein HemP